MQTQLSKPCDMHHGLCGHGCFKHTVSPLHAALAFSALPQNYMAVGPPSKPVERRFTAAPMLLVFHARRRSPNWYAHKWAAGKAAQTGVPVPDAYDKPHACFSPSRKHTPKLTPTNAAFAAHNGPTQHRPRRSIPQMVLYLKTTSNNTTHTCCYGRYA